MMNWMEEAKQIQQDMVSWRRHLHENPEIGMELVHTSAYVKKELENMGYAPQVCGKTGLVALAGGKKAGKVFMLRADMDALPMKEETELPYQSTNDYMHACGHDLHTAMLLGAAKLLKAHEDEIDGTVKLMFQPAEETLEGAKAMIDDGLLEGPKVDAAMMIHVFAGMPMPAGQVLVPGGGVLSAAADWFDIDVLGKGGHGAMPEHTIDPLTTVAHMHLALQEMMARELPGSANAVVTVGKMGGGDINNIIPDTAVLNGTIRTFDSAVRDTILKRIPEIAEGVATTFRAKAECRIRVGCPSVVVDEALSDAVYASLQKELGIDVVPAIEREKMAGGMSGSEDFAYVTQQVPSVMLMLTAGSPEYGQHNPKVCFDESVMPNGAAAYACAAMSWLRNN